MEPNNIQLDVIYVDIDVDVIGENRSWIYRIWMNSTPLPANMEEFLVLPSKQLEQLQNISQDCHRNRKLLPVFAKLLKVNQEEMDFWPVETKIG